jgi:uncharacterized protein (UPF0333 family)
MFNAIIANVLFAVVLFVVGAGVYLLSGDPGATVLAALAVGAFMKFDDYRIRKARRNVVC